MHRFTPELPIERMGNNERRPALVETGRDLSVRPPFAIVSSLISSP
jgi:hypothetical protein